MAKEPWFKAWSADILTDEKMDAMPPEAEGLLWRMWCVCNLRGCIPSDHEEIARLTCRKMSYVSLYVSYCLPFFDLRDGNLYSHRMEREKEKSAKARESVSHRKDRSTTNRTTNGSTNRTTQKARMSESQNNPIGDVPEDSDNTIFKIAKAYPKLSHLRNETEIPRAIADEIIRAINTDSADDVLRGTIEYGKITEVQHASDPWKYFHGYMYRLTLPKFKPLPISPAERRRKEIEEDNRRQAEEALRKAN